MWPRMGASVISGTAHLPQVPVTLLEPGTEEEIVPSKGYHHTPEALEKMSAASLGRHHSPETKARIGAANKGERNPMKRLEIRAKLSASKMGHQVSPETRAKISAALTGKHLSPEVREKIRVASLGRRHTPEAREKMRRAKLGKVCSPETREKVGASKKGRPLSPEHKAKVGAASRSAWSRPEYREKMRAARSRPEVRERISGSNASNWRGGVSFEPYCPKFSKEFKERVRAFWGRTYVLCQTPENGKALSVHHVHANKDACCDEGSPRQFVALCKSCHSKVGGAGKAKAEEHRVHFQEMIAFRGGRSYLPKEEVMT